MSIVKALRFPVDAQWRGARSVLVSAATNPDLDVTPPPELRGVEGRWSPEQLLVGATASCFAITLAAVAERLELPLGMLDVSGTGHVSRRGDGRFGFVAIDLDVVLETTPGAAHLVDEAIRLTE